MQTIQNNLLNSFRYNCPSVNMFLIKNESWKLRKRNESDHFNDQSPYNALISKSHYRKKIVVMFLNKIMKINMKKLYFGILLIFIYLSISK